MPLATSKNDEFPLNHLSGVALDPNSVIGCFSQLDYNCTNLLIWLAYSYGSFTHRR